MARLFGTAGVRGVANVELTPELAFKLGRAAATYFGRETTTPKIIIGRDTRLSGTMLEAALAAGICSAGGNAHLLGVMPTPAVSFLTPEVKANAGVVISASHNPFEDNGIKFFSKTGHKLPDAVEDEIAELVSLPVECSKNPRGSSVGQVIVEEGLDKLYIDHVIAAAPCKLNGLKVVMDCSNGANSVIAPVILRSLGVEVVTIFNQPNGININNGCGSTHLEALQAKVVEVGADVGIANDGDADRCLVVDEKGEALDGDQMMLICALELMKKKQLKDNVLITTVMSNVGLHQAMKKYGGSCVKTAVGDRYVLEEMLKNGYSLGWEQSGHIIFSKYASTVDGILTSLKMMEVIMARKKKLSELTADLAIYPQVLENVRVHDKAAAQADVDVQAAVERVAEALGDTGRILVRESGTEPLLRVMVEAESEELCRKYVDQVVEIVRKKGHVAE